MQPHAASNILPLLFPLFHSEASLFIVYFFMEPIVFDFTSNVQAQRPGHNKACHGLRMVLSDC